MDRTEEHLTSITLFKNNKFDYTNKEKLAHQYSSGTWLKMEDKIHLTSDTVYKIGIIDTKEDVDKEISSTNITLLNSAGDFIVGATITINNNQNEGWNTNESGYVTFPKKNIDSITVHYLGQQYSYRVKNPNSNIFELTVRMDDLSTKYFNNEVWELKGKHLISPLGNIFRLKSSE
ncbi:hypothetical protein ACG2LH_16585 [Zhouia sp. PK063]|uniref:hypothetical protein n=1 Tax=Zhouia sp. PK063 TaxID=3373602 RepID=UPI0037BDCFD0